MLRILFATTELSPWIKVGGLADVSASLPKALQRHGCEVSVVLPGYASLGEIPGPARLVSVCNVLGHPVCILEAELRGLRLFLVDSPGLFHRDGDPYSDGFGRDHADNALRFAVFCRAIEALVRSLTGTARAPDVVHLNDWPTALAAGFLADLPRRPRLVFSIHNLAHQGNFPGDVFASLALPAHWWSFQGVEFHGQISFIKAGIIHADAVTTVSPTYAGEICESPHGRGLEGLIRHVAGKLTGIVNGIDREVWDPATDSNLVAPYDGSSLRRKAQNKAALLDELGMLVEEGVPLVGFIGRLVEQKGVDLIVGAMDAIVSMPALLVVLGTGEGRWETALRAAEQRHPRRIRFVPRMDESLAHRIEAGADVFLMPSRFEPCGLNQMYSMRYGTVPVVRRTGGLADTVRDVRGEAVGDGTGFLFDEYTADALVGTLRRALTLFRHRKTWKRIQRNGMNQDFSWGNSARSYLDLYRRLVSVTPGGATTTCGGTATSDGASVSTGPKSVAPTMACHVQTRPRTPRRHTF